MPTTSESIENTMSQLKCCVIVPTYNNAKTLSNVLDGLLRQTDDVIVINDGSTDDTKEILAAYAHLSVIQIDKNKGKGNALRRGFEKALSLGFDFAITIDSDGQHFPEDIPVFIDALQQAKDKDVLLIGSRDMDHESVPKKSSFGNKFSNFWLWVTTGKTLADTQAGFRLYPIRSMENIKLRTTKFEFEIEAMVKSSWKGIALKNVPIRVLYDDSERVSHYRPTIDFLRISLLNTWLVLVALIYIKPRDLFRKFRKKGFKRFFYEDF
ncbi:MAG: glycosyltransferase family 2 protein, partial [Aurantibacter sp.]